MKNLKRVFLAAVLFLSMAVMAGASGFVPQYTFTPDQFSDVPEEEWYYDSVGSTYELGLMNGTGGGLFEPNREMTVAEVITLASRAAAICAGESIDTAADGAWYMPYVRYAVEKSLIREDSFDDYEREAKRLEVAQIFAKVLEMTEKEPYNEVESIPDVSENKPYHASVLALYRCGVMMGSDAYGNFFPENSIIRSEVSAVISRIAFPEKRLKKSLDKISEADAYKLVITPQMDSLKEGINSGWVLDNRAGMPRTQLSETYTRLIDVDKAAEAALIREFNDITTGRLVLEAKATVMYRDGVYLEYRNNRDESVFRIETKDGWWQVVHGNDYTPVYDIELFEQNFVFHITVDLDNGRSAVAINYRDCGSFPLAVSGESRNIRNFRFATAKEAQSAIAPQSVYINVNYAVYESFDYMNNGLPYDWSGSGTSAQENTLKIEANGSAAKGFSPVSGKAVAEFMIRLPEKQAMKAELKSGQKSVITFSSDSSRFYVNGKPVYENYYGNMWYRLRLELDTDSMTALVKLNGREIAQADFSERTTSVDSICFANASNSPVYVDTVRVYRMKEHEDYVPEPVIPAGSENYTVGVNVCSLWSNGIADGWACITPYDEAKPVLGYYDETVPETADWEIKYMVEHGIDFQAFCVFANSSDGPLKMEANHLHDGFMNAKYSDKMKFSLIWEAANASSPASMEAWKTYYVPYFIENYFKDARYMTIDNRPVLAVFGVDDVCKRLALGESGVKEAFDYLENEVKKLGFDGMLYLACGGHSGNLAAMGYDGWYPYSWGTEGYSLDVNITSMKNSVLNESVYAVPTVSVGFNSIPWHGIRYPLMSVTDYKAAHSWVKSTYLPTYAKEKWQNNFVMLSTWNEYGEGTYIMPSGLNGFGYLDVLREAYTDETADEKLNAVPNSVQRERINHLYPQYRRLLRKQGAYTPDIRLDKLDKVYTVDYSKLSPETPGITNVSRSPAYGLSGVSTHNDPAIRLNAVGGNISLESIAAMRVTAQIPAGDYMEIYYTTANQTGWSQSKSVRVTSTSDKMTEYVIATNNLTAWNGILYGLRIDPATAADASFAVKSVEFYADPNYLPKKMEINGKRFDLSFAPIRTEAGDTLVAFDPKVGMDFRLNAYHVWDKENGVLTLYFKEHTLIYTLGSDRCEVDGAARDLGFTLTELDGLPLLPFKQLCDAVGYTFAWGDDRILRIETDQKPFFETVETEIPGQYEFNTDGCLEGWEGSAMSMIVENGYMKCFSISPNNDPYMYSPAGATYEAERYSAFECRVRYRYQSEKPLQIRVYFTTQTDSRWSEAKTLVLPLSSTDSGGEWETCTYSLADNAAWDGTITRLRFDPFDAAGFMDIDYIRLVQKDGYVWIDPDKRPFTIVNGDAEDVFNPGFVGYVNESGITADPDKPSNNCYYVMGEADKNAYMYLYQPVRYKPGATYKVECDVRLMSYGTSLEIPADMVTTICANARYVQEDGTYDHVIDKKVEKLSQADGWVHWSFEFTVAENRVESARDQLAFYSNPKNNNGFGFYLDNVVVTEELPKEDEASDS